MKQDEVAGECLFGVAKKWSLIVKGYRSNIFNLGSVIDIFKVNNAILVHIGPSKRIWPLIGNVYLKYKHNDEQYFNFPSTR